MKISFWITALIILFTGSTLSAQSDVPYKHNLSLGAGFPNLPVAFFNIYDSKKNFNIYDSKKNFNVEGKGPYHLKYENRINAFLSLGLNINHMSYHVSYTEDVLDTVKGIVLPNNIDIKSHNTAFNVRCNVHFINPEKSKDLDVYFGMGLGFRLGELNVSSQYSEYTPSIKLPSLSKIGFETTIGMRYFLTDNIGLYAEFGPAKSLVQSGLNVRF